MTYSNQKNTDVQSRIEPFPGSYAAFADRKLVELVRDNDERAFEQLMHRYLPIVTAFLWGKMWERSEIADLSQEIFIRAYTRIGQLRDPAKFNHWILRIARHAWADHCRSPYTQRRKSHVELENIDQHDKGHLIDDAPDPARSAGKRELDSMVQEAIGELKERYRLILYLRLIEEKTNPEVARLTGLKENAVRTRFSRGLETLRKALIKKGLQPF
jgi:RNA polymerase sigma-70 factor (ECF subfamily)